MINTRRTIFQTLKKRIRELTKHAQLAPQEFKKIMLAVIVNDLKEWSEYIPKDDPNAIVNLLNNYLLNNCFIIDRMPNEDSLAYVNVNTPQTNDTWKRIWDGSLSETKTPEISIVGSGSYTPDPNCKTEAVYFFSYDEQGSPISNLEYLEYTYGEHGDKLKTVCDKMDIFIDRETGEAWYLDTDGNWQPVGGGQSDWTEEEILNLVTDTDKVKVHHYQNEDESDIHAELSRTQNDPIEFCTDQEVEDLI